MQKDKIVEAIAERVHEAMVWAAKQPGEPQEWQNGNSLAEDMARGVASRAAALAAQPRDDVVERYELALVKILNLADEGSDLQRIADAALAAQPRDDVVELLQRIVNLGASETVEEREALLVDIECDAQKYLGTLTTQPDKAADDLAGELEEVLWLVNAVEGNIRTTHKKQADQLMKVWRILTALRARTDRKAVLEEACEGGQRDEGATFVLEALAKQLGVEDWSIADGTESWSGDVEATLMQILVKANVVNDWDGSIARHQPLTKDTDQ